MSELRINMENKILLEIHNKQSMSLPSLTLSLLNLSQQFNRFLERQGLEASENSGLYIKTIKSGSIIIELVTLINNQPFTLIETFNTCFDFLGYLKKSFDYFLVGSKEKPVNYDKKDLQQLSECLSPVANDPGSTIKFIAQDSATQNINITINSTEANAIQNKIRNEIDNFAEEKQSKYNKQLLIWYQTRFAKDSKTGDMAIIENITKKPIKVIFANDQLKQDIINTQGFSKSWQNLAYIVDVEALYMNGKLRRYKIVSFYPEETFDPENENYELTI